MLPLKTMCSKKWLIPETLASSFLDPVLTQTVTVTDSKLDMGTVKTLKPEESVCNL